MLNKTLNTKLSKKKVIKYIGIVYQINYDHIELLYFKEY